MANDPRDMDGKGLQRALYLLGRNGSLRGQLMEFLKNAEKELKIDGSVRDEITGPIVDALHDEKDVYEKSLADGTRFVMPQPELRILGGGRDSGRAAA